MFTVVFVEQRVPGSKVAPIMIYEDEHGVWYLRIL